MNHKIQKKIFSKKLRKYSNPMVAQRKAHVYLGKSVKLYPARNTKKKYSVFDPIHQKWVNLDKWDMRIIPNIVIKKEEKII